MVESSKSRLAILAPIMAPSAILVCRFGIAACPIVERLLTLHILSGLNADAKVMPR